MLADPVARAEYDLWTVEQALITARASIARLEKLVAAQRVVLTLSKEERHV